MSNQLKQAEPSVALENAATLVSLLLDNADYFADVEGWALDHSGFTAEGVKELLNVETGPLNLWFDVEGEEVDWEAAARSLNEEFGYAVHSTEVVIRTQAYRIDELGRERLDLDYSVKDWRSGDSLSDYIYNLHVAVRGLLTKGEAASGS